MYKKILVTLDATPSDRAIIEHVKELAKMACAAGWCCCTWPTDGRRAPTAAMPSAREITEDTAYLETGAGGISGGRHSGGSGVGVWRSRAEIVSWVEQKGCDLIAMSTHGHRFLADIFLGTTASHVQHNVSVPVLLLRAK